MPNFDVAHIHHQGIDLIIIPLESAYHRKSTQEQNQDRATLQARATAAGLRGTVVPVWDAGFGQLAFLAPPAWAPFFKSISLAYVAANLNRRLSWS